MYVTGNLLMRIWAFTARAGKLDATPFIGSVSIRTADGSPGAFQLCVHAPGAPEFGSGGA